MADFTKGLYIDGTYFDVPFISIKRSADFLFKYAKRNLAGVLLAELIGVYFNYTVTFGVIDDMALYDRLWNKLTEPKVFHTIKIPRHNGTYYTYTAYMNNVSDEFEKILSDRTVMSGLTATFTAKSPARTPS